VNADTVSLILIAVGAVGIVVRSVTFYRVTIPQNYGSNPGFGAYEVTVIPWWLLVCVGLGVRTSPLVGWASFIAGAFGLGFFGQLLAVAFRRVK
jgi:hypothetical protein